MTATRKDLRMWGEELVKDNRELGQSLLKYADTWDQEVVEQEKRYVKAVNNLVSVIGTLTVLKEVE